MTTVLSKATPLKTIVDSMGKFLFTTLLLGIFTVSGIAQENDSIPNASQEIDSLQADLKEEGIIVVDTLKKKKVRINPLAPSKAAFYSAAFPGLGQIYNKRYWKAPIVWGVLGGAIYGYVYNDDLYRRFRTAFKRRQAGFTDDEFYDPFGGVGQIPRLDQDDLQNQQEARQRDRDLWLVGVIAVYILNIVDANVDAHLKQFNVDEDLSFDMQPFLDVDPIMNRPNYGMAVVVRF
ncbi:DUF5683 domain-containing protein [Pricia sp. S334]|uniref:DUF5683 domain-containing protein n=1 Tax=Pricia mediterranea TaxID=3076079 RepID=A0ABU3L0U7_9FLAO|nr:DUF5683 domain-containing protein [Pricia sp. S334]MDT7827359.1 DUF5683 domain-containing protein [Pricia sp. S334]